MIACYVSTHVSDFVSDSFLALYFLQVVLQRRFLCRFLSCNVEHTSRNKEVHEVR